MTQPTAQSPIGRFLPRPGASALAAAAARPDPDRAARRRTTEWHLTHIHEVLARPRTEPEVLGALARIGAAWQADPPPLGPPAEWTAPAHEPWEGRLLGAIAPAFRCGTLERDSLRLGGGVHAILVTLTLHETLLPHAERIVSHAISHDPRAVAETVRRWRRAELERAGDVVRPRTRAIRLGAQVSPADRACVRAYWLGLFAAAAGLVLRDGARVTGMSSSPAFAMAGD